MSRDSSEQLRVCFRTSNTVSKSLVNTKDKIPVTHRSGVYRIKCSHPDCNVCYIGQSGRRIETRVKEHSKLIEKNISRFITNTFSPFANHIIEAGHKFEPEADTKVLHVC